MNLQRIMQTLGGAAVWPKCLFNLQCLLHILHPAGALYTYGARISVLAERFLLPLVPKCKTPFTSVRWQSHSEASSPLNLQYSRDQRVHLLPLLFTVPLYLSTVSRSVYGPRSKEGVSRKHYSPGHLSFIGPCVCLCVCVQVWVSILAVQVPTIAYKRTSLKSTYWDIHSSRNYILPCPMSSFQFGFTWAVVCPCCCKSWMQNLKQKCPKGLSQSAIGNALFQTVVGRSASVVNRTQGASKKWKFKSWPTHCHSQRESH